jgi:hypothetical protein
MERPSVSNLTTNLKSLSTPDTARTWQSGFNENVGGDVLRAFTNNWIAPAAQIPYAAKETFGKNKTGWERGVGGIQLAGNLASTFFPGIEDLAYMGLQGVKGYTKLKRQGATKEEQLLELKRNVTGQNYTGLGDALSDDPTVQTIGNLAELPLMIAGGVISRKAALKDLETVKANAPAIKEFISRARAYDLLDPAQQMKVWKDLDTYVDMAQPGMTKGKEWVKLDIADKFKYGLRFIQDKYYLAFHPEELKYAGLNTRELKGKPIQPPSSVNPKGSLQTQPVPDFQTGKILSTQQSGGGVPIRTTANEAVSSPNIITEKGQLNINKLNVEGAGKEVLQVQEANVKPTVIGNKQVVDMARTAKGTGTLTDETMTKLMAQQLKNRQVVVDLTEQFNNAKKSGASDVELAKIMLNISDQSKTARQGGTFAGRILQAQNILADESATPMQKIFALLDNAGIDNKKYMKDAVKVDWENPTQVVDFYRKYVPPKFGEILDEIRYSNMLSSPLTHIVNTASNALQTGVIAPVEKTITGALDWGKSTLTGSERKYYTSAGIDYAGGYIKALPEAFTKFKKVLSGEQVLVKPDYERIPTGTKGILSKYTTPLKMLEAADQFFKTLVEGGVTSELKKSPQKLSTIQISSQATKEANYRLFRQAFDPNGEMGSGIVLRVFDKWNSAIANLRRLPGGKWVLPFLQTPTNILKQGVEFSPLGFTTAIGAKAPIEQISKALIGTSVFLGAYGLAKSGLTTWDAPASGSERDLYYAAGMQPYSVKIGGNWVSYSKLGPLSYPIAMAAALANAEKKNPDKTFIQNVGQGVSGILGFFGDQSYVRSIGDLVDAIRGGGNMGSSALTSEGANLAGQLIPYHSFLTWLGRLTDPTYYKASNFSEKLMKDIPIIGKNLQPYTDLQGNPSKRDYPLINAVSPYQVTQQKEPAAGMLQTLQSQKIGNDVQKRADEAFLAGDATASVGGGTYRYVEDGTLKKIETNKVTSMPEGSNYQKALKEKEAYKLVDNIMASGLKPEEKQQALQDLGISTEDATYYNIAKESTDLKNVYITDEINRIMSGTTDRGQMLNYLASQRKEVNGDMILADAVVTQLYNDEIISKSEATMLKNLKIVNGKPVVKLTGRGAKTAIKKVSALGTPTKISAPKIKTMAQLLAKSGKIRTKNYNFKKTI